LERNDTDKGGLTILVIAGYGHDADKLPAHSDFIAKSTQFALERQVDMIFAVGGATNPDFPDSTEAEATFRTIRKEVSCSFDVCKAVRYQIHMYYLRKNRQENERIIDGILNRETANKKPILPVVVLGKGNTSADTLIAVRDTIIDYGLFVNELILAAECSRATGFVMDAFYVGLLQLTRSWILYTKPFPETKKEYWAQKKKLLLKLLSHRYPLFRWLRYLYQKRHQRKVAKIKRQQSAAPRS